MKMKHKLENTPNVWELPTKEVDYQKEWEEADVASTLERIK